MLTADDIEGRDFLVSLRGFDRAEVRAFLAEVAEHVRELEARAQAAEDDQAARAGERQAEAGSSGTAGTAGSAGSAGEERQAVQEGQGFFADIGRETQRILEAAEEAAKGIARQARVDADRQLQSARRQAARLIADGEQRREEAEEIVAGLEAARGALSGQLRDIAATIERVIGELGTSPVPASTVREALTSELGSPPREPDRPQRPSEPPAPEQPPSTESVDEPDVEEEPVPEPEPAAEVVAEPDAEDEPAEPEARGGPEPVDEPVPADEPERVVERAAERDERDEGTEHVAGAPPEPSAHKTPPPWLVAPPAADAAVLPEPDGEPDDQVVEESGPQPAPDAGEETDGDLAEVIDLQGTEEEPSDPLGLRGSALAPLHPQLVRAIKRGLQDVQNVALDRMRRTGGEGEPESLLPGDEEVDAIGVSVTAILQESYRAGVAAASRLAARGLPDPGEERELVADFLADASQRVRSPLAATLRMARSSGEGAPGVTDRVSAVFAELRGTVAEELASTHLVRSYEFGLLDAWAAGGVTRRRWVLGREPRCPEARCRHNARTGVVAMGETYPSGHEVPPVHVGCNCTTIPISEPP